MAAAAKIFAVGDAILDDVEQELKSRALNYRKLSLDDKLAFFVKIAANRMAASLGVSFERIRPFITDYIGFGPSIYEHHHTMDVAKKASFLGLSGAELHSVDLGGASAPATLELARKLCSDEERLVLIAGSEVPRGGDAGVRYYREVSDALLDKDSEFHTQANLISLYALLADRLMFENGITSEVIEEITAYYRGRATGNQRAAVYKKELKPGELRRYLAGPYATAMVAVATDHGFAALVAHEAYLQRMEKSLGFTTAGKSFYINGVGTNYADKYLTRRRDFSSPAALAARRAFSHAGISPGQIDYAWIYDCFTLMLVRQAADYFDLSVSDAAQTLRAGHIVQAGKKIPVNNQGGILNTQAAISLSATTGLLDIFDFAAQNPAAEHFLFGGNGGIDCVNSVAILSRLPLPHKATVVRAEPAPLGQMEKIAEGETGILYAAVMVRFNPGADVPFALGAFRRQNGSLCLARMFRTEGNPCEEVESLVRDEIMVRFSYRDGRPVALLV